MLLPVLKIYGVGNKASSAGGTQCEHRTKGIPRDLISALAAAMWQLP